MTDTVLAEAETAAGTEGQEGAESATGAQTEHATTGAAEGAQAGAEGATAANEGATETDWRTEFAAGDERLLKFLGKYTDPKKLAADAKASKDKLLQRAASKLPENPTDEELAAFRKEQGIPDKPEGYLDTLPSGIVVGEDDRPVVDQFVQAMHASNAPKAAVDAALSSYYKIVEEQEAARIEAMDTAREEGINLLREEWGADYKRNVNAVKSYVATLPEAVGKAIGEGVNADGVPLASDPHVIQWLAELALEKNPLNTVVPGAGANQASAVADEIATIETMMRDLNSEYWRGPKADKMQARYRDLVAARDKLK